MPHTKCECEKCMTRSILTYGTSTSGVTHQPNCTCTMCVPFTTGTIISRPCGASWSIPCYCYMCSTASPFRITTTTLPVHEKGEFVANVLDEIDKNPYINDFKKEVVGKVAAIQALNKALTFLSGLNLQNHPVKDQREQADVLREIMKVLKPERYNK